MNGNARAASFSPRESIMCARIFMRFFCWSFSPIDVARANFFSSTNVNNFETFVQRNKTHKFEHFALEKAGEHALFVVENKFNSSQIWRQKAAAFCCLSSPRGGSRRHFGCVIRKLISATRDLKHQCLFLCAFWVGNK